MGLKINRPNIYASAQLDSAKEILKSLNEEAATARNVWLAFNSILAFLAVTTLGITHEDLLFNRPIRLPVVDIAIPLTSFAKLAPLLLLIMLFAVLLQHALLAHKAIAFNDTVQPFVNHKAIEELRFRAGTYFFIQNIVAPNQNAILKFSTRVMSFITLDTIPLLVLLLIQFQFLPEQNAEITNIQRVIICLATSTVFVFGLLRRRPTLKLHQTLWLLLKENKLALSFLAGTVVLAACASLFIGTGAQERGAWYDYSETVQGHYIFDRKIDDVSGRPTALFSQRLVLQKLDVNSESMKAQKVNFRGRNFVEADFSGSKLDGVDFNASNLDRANFSDASLIRVKISCTDSVSKNYDNTKEGISYNDPPEHCASLRQANLNDANLQFADIDYISLEGASMQEADLRFVEFSGTNLDGTDFRGSKFSKLMEDPATTKFADFRGSTIEIFNFWNFLRTKNDLEIYGVNPLSKSAADFRSSRIWTFKEIYSRESLEMEFDETAPDIRDLRTNPPEKRDFDFWKEQMNFDPELKKSTDNGTKLDLAFHRLKEHFDFISTQKATTAEGEEKTFVKDVGKFALLNNSYEQASASRAAWMVKTVCERPILVESLIRSYYDGPKLKKPSPDSISSNFFVGSAYAWDDRLHEEIRRVESYGGSICACDGPIHGANPNFNTRDFAIGIRSCPAYGKLNDNFKYAIENWSKRWDREHTDF
jgi:uncharacterized protein YjbI with pentapeptide repeats